MLTRRQLLRGGAAAALAAPFLSLLERSARAGGTTTPAARRLLIFQSPNGTIHQHWRPTPGPTLQIRPGTILEPLMGLEDHIAVIDGLRFHNATNHEAGQQAMLTNNGAAGSVGGGMSVDQFVAQQLGGTTRFDALTLGVLTGLWGGGRQTRMSYTAPGTFVTPDDSPASVYQRMWGELVGDAEAAARAGQRRQTVLDVAREDLASLHARLGYEERQKLDQHLDALQTVEQQLFSPSDASCTAGTPPMMMSAGSNAAGADLLSAQMDLAVESLACGLTNVATVQFSHTVSPVVFSWLGKSDGHHSLSHASDSDTTGVADFVDCERWCAAQFAALIQRLQARPNPDGPGTLLDDTLVVWAKEMGDPRAHVCTDVPFVLAGGGGAAFTPNRYLSAGGQTHAKLLVSICHAMGIMVDTFGDAGAGSGPLGGLA